MGVVTTARAVSVAKSAAGTAVSMLGSLSYAMAFSYTNGVFVYGAMAVSFVLFTAPIWMGMFGRPMRRWLVYYLLVAIVLVLGVMARFVIEALSASA